MHNLRIILTPENNATLVRGVDIEVLIHGYREAHMALDLALAAADITKPEVPNNG